ncbi:hypothetical protein EJP80_03290 [Rahnella aquatilis]|nr:hypothetical protein EJP80_03290 [Rahnella aquatilis]
MRREYMTLVNGLLKAYHFKAENLRTAHAISDEVRTFSLNDYAFRLTIGLDGLYSAAQAAGDFENAIEIEQLVIQCNDGFIPQPVENTGMLETLARQ